MLADELRGLFLLEGLDESQLRELAAAGEEVPFTGGDILFNEGDHADDWWVLLEGNIDLVRHAGQEEVVVLMTWDRPGLWAGGFRAWDESSGYLATARAVGEGRIFRIPSTELGRLVRAWFPFSVHLIEGFFQTVRRMDTMSRQREALVALGRLAAGVAHEINNPASASARAVDELDTTLNSAVTSLMGLTEAAVSADEFRAIDELRLELIAAEGLTDQLAIAELEDALTEWLDDHDVDDSWRIAPVLATAGVDVDFCERVAAALPMANPTSAFEWLVATLTIRALLDEMKDATGRITALVDAVKSYSQLDRASMQLIDVTDGIDTTLVMLRRKLDDVTVERDYGDTPRIEANPAELNQVWTNLFDNAIDAMDGSGTLRIATRVDDYFVIEISDTGSGMSPDVQARAFEPFFTTKDVGKGTGLGLDISRRIIVDRHHGKIAFDSSSHGTTVTVRLPIPESQGDDAP